MASQVKAARSWAPQPPRSGPRQPTWSDNNPILSGAPPGRRSSETGARACFDQKRQVSRGGGCQPLWRKDGKELFYLTLDYKLMAVEVIAGSQLNTSNARLQFQT